MCSMGVSDFRQEVDLEEESTIVEMHEAFPTKTRNGIKDIHNGTIE